MCSSDSRNSAHPVGWPLVLPAAVALGESARAGGGGGWIR